MNGKTIRVGIIGFGTVGSGTAEVLLNQKELLQKKIGGEVILAKVADIKIDGLPDFASAVTFTKDAANLIDDPEIDIVVELIGGIEPAKSFILRAIDRGKHVVTANKALISQHGREIFTAAAAKGVEVGFEASVGGGIPVIKALKEGLVANQILSIIGILNGTANYILTRMTDEGASFDAVLKDAQALGYAEADPTYDVEGIDTAHKLAILMSMAYGSHIDLKDISIEGITRIEPIDIALAREFGFRIKLLAISRSSGDHVEARVHATMVPEKHMLANINGAYNGIYFTGDKVGNVLLYGLGAGKVPTGSAVAADIVDIARDILHNSVGRVPSLAYLPQALHPVAITPMEKLHCPYYCRITTLDKPGVLSKISGILGDHGISIETVVQKGKHASGLVPIVMLTYEAEEAAVRKALAAIDRLDCCHGETVMIRILVN